MKLTLNVTAHEKRQIEKRAKQRGVGLTRFVLEHLPMTATKDKGA